jgi:perosamine synthetase
MYKLAINGGKKAKKTPFGTGKRFGNTEIIQLIEALDQNTLFYWKGKKVKEFTAKFAQMYGAKYCVAASSGTASIHVALGTVGVAPGDEVITSPITDIGTLIGILYQNAIPIFADVDPHTYNLDPKSIEKKITDKTKVILVVHKGGNPTDMDAVMKIAKKHKVKVIEDCAQSYLCWYKGKLAGTIGDVGCFSLNDFKHISAGDGGMCLMNNEEMYIRAMRFADKNYNRLVPYPDSIGQIDDLAPNYRMTELQGAVAIAQLDKLEWICDQRNVYGEGITKGISGLPGIYPHKITEGGKSSYWFYMFRIDEKEAGVSRDEFSEALEAEGVPNEAVHTKTVYENGLFLNKNAYPGTDCPFGCKYYGREVSYYKGMCPTAEAVYKTAIRLQVNEFFTGQDLKEVVKAIRKVSNFYTNK